ncbi:N-acetylmuramoyl-L-alanine amidase [Nocardia thailandica]
MRILMLPVLGAVVALSACASTAGTAPGGRPAAAQPAPSAASATTPAVTPIAARRVVVLDPGHNGGNAAHPGVIGAPVPDGRGGTKACNTTGTAGADGYPEHAFTWALAALVRDRLTVAGIEVILTRDSDDGVGPCVDERAAIGNRAGADAVVSLHADGNAGAEARGFHIAHSAPPLSPVQAGPGLALATALRDAFVAGGFTPSTYTGAAGLDPRADLAGLNLAQRPAALVECGNMRHPTDAADLGSAAGQARFADAVAAGILAFLG